jgi:hypothetical protein
MSDSQRKTIQIIPEHFKIHTSSKTRKKREPGTEQPPKLRMKNEKPKINKSTKNQVLKYIRQQQEQKYKKLLENQPSETEGGVTNTIRVPSTINEFDSDFKQSLDFLNTISENTKMLVQPKNSTLKNYLYDPGNSNSNSNSNVYTSLPDVFSEMVTHTTAPPLSIPRPTMMPLTSSHGTYGGNIPQYGCLKGGALPTYRMWKNKTQRTIPVVTGAGTLSDYIREPVNHGVGVSNIHHMDGRVDINDGSLSDGDGGGTELALSQNALLERFKSPNFMKKKHEIQGFQKKKDELKAQKQKPMFRRRKQKKTMRRTFRLGKSKHYPRVSVLVSNRTLRKQISSRCQELKQVPLDEVKKTLIKKGFIKVGSIAPNDVLRKMYESVSLVCGDIQNHNSDNLVYNYFNDADNKHT